jgi:hypothetical protein
MRSKELILGPIKTADITYEDLYDEDYESITRKFLESRKNKPIKKFQ